MPVRLEQWSLGSIEPKDGYTAPEAMLLRLRGNAYGHPNYPDGHTINTSMIESVEGDTVKCLSRDYVLGEPAAEYVAWCKEKGFADPKDSLTKARTS